MHWHILKVPNGMFTDHKDGDGLNNQRSNLRVCTIQQNNRNQRPRKGCSSSYKGVCYHKQIKRWRAYIDVDRKRINLGCYGDELSAAKAYNQEAQNLFGEFAKLNEI